MKLQPNISSNQNPWVKAVHKLHHSTERRRQQLFLVEGTHLIQEAVATSWPLESICFSEEWSIQNHAIIANIVAHPAYRNTLLQPVSEDVLRKLSTTDSLCPAIGIARFQNPSTELPTLTSMQIAAESLRDPGNLGALVRISAAVGNCPIILSPDSVDPTNPKVLRSTAGQWFRNRPVVVDNLLEYVLRNRSQGVQILAAAADGTCFWECDLTLPTMFLLGNEGSGLSHELRAAATKTVAIPMAPNVESLNVAISGALLAYESQRQRSAR
jgi:TrmH family RNA methyltransferase